MRIYIADGNAKANKGGFAVGGISSGKASTTEYLRVTTDSTRIYVNESTSGFGVASIGGGTTESFLDLTKQNYFIGHQTGESTTSGS